MTPDLSAAIARATTQTRAGDPFAATRTLQAALGRRAPERADEIVLPGTVHPRRGHRLDPEAEIVEPAPEPRTNAAPRSPRRGLGAVIRTLREGRARLEPLTMPGTRPAQAPAIPDGARFETRRAAHGPLARGYKIYVPSSGQANGLVVMLHGCKQSPDDFATGTAMNAQAEAHGLIVAYPHQTGTDNASCCWNWFLPAHQARDGGEPSIIAALTRAIVAEFDIDPSRVFVAGLSAGGAMAAVLGQTHPDLFRAIGVHSGLPHGAARDVVTAFAAMRGDAPAAPRTPNSRPEFPRTIVFHGTADAVVHPANAARIVDAAGVGAATDRTHAGLSDAGRSYTRRVIADAQGRTRVEAWTIDGGAHAWMGGDARGSYTDPRGPDASAEMVRFFLEGA